MNPISALAAKGAFWLKYSSCGARQSCARNNSSFMRRAALRRSGGIRILETREFVEVNVFFGYTSGRRVKASGFSPNLPGR